LAHFHHQEEYCELQDHDEWCHSLPTRKTKHRKKIMRKKVDSIDMKEVDVLHEPFLMQFQA
jgi:hypothetical protein